MPPAANPRRRRAMREAESLLASLDVRQPPASDTESLVALARKLGVNVVRKPLEPETSGLLVWRDDGSAVIGINSEHPPQRQHFTLAHELGHWALHSEESGVFLDEFTVHYRGGGSGSYDPRESEANAFAAAFLMPEKMLREEIASQRRIDASDDKTLKQIADSYGVSVQALTIRLTNLNLLAF